ncbi:MAG TPA: prolyl oligopeptidase family serine peptidase, partial [Candidatus Dormibacteraeota bacterium]|nr:prolyl oligopeptidase family serine peptidase [Candidatus Dormibacteraeota bacterium]
GRINLAQDAPDATASTWLLGHGFAIAGSSYSSTGWAVADALKDQIAVLDLFNQRFAKPKRVIAWGVSLGGIVTAGLVQAYPDRFAAAIPLCGVLAGGVATWNAGLDAAYAFKTLLAPASQVQLVGITDPQTNIQLAGQIFDAASATPAGQARIALIAALGDLPGWFDIVGPQPAPTDYAGQEAAQARWESQVDFPFEFQYRADLEQKAGGNPSWNTGVDYAHQLAISANSAEVTALYRAAGLDLAADLRALNAGKRIKANPSAVAYLDQATSFDGNLTVPVLTMHTIGDGLVVPQNETAYADVVLAAGKQDMLRQLFVHRAGHCAFSDSETIVAFQAMLARLDTGRWDDAALSVASLNSAAQALGDTYNKVGGFLISPPSFASFAAGPYPRPFPKGSHVPT